MNRFLKCTFIAAMNSTFLIKVKRSIHGLNPQRRSAVRNFYLFIKKFSILVAFVSSLGSHVVFAAQDGGYDITSELWAKAVLNVTNNPITLIWQEVGAATTPSGDKVISGYFYADPNTFAYGNQYNPEVFVKIYIATSGWCNMAFNHVTVDPVTIQTAQNYTGTYNKTGTITTTSRLIEHSYTIGTETGSKPNNQLMTEKLQGNWTFYFTLLDTHERTYYLNYPSEESDNDPGTYNIFGYNQWGQQVVAWYSPSSNDFFVLDPNPADFDLFFVFDFVSSNDVSGLYFHVINGVLDANYPMEGHRVSSGFTQLGSKTIRTDMSQSDNEKLDYEISRVASARIGGISIYPYVEGAYLILKDELERKNENSED